MWKRIGKALLYPPMALLVLLTPIAIAFLVCSMVRLGSESPISIASYVLAAYTLTVWCLRVPALIRFFRTVRQQNRYLIRWREDARLRVNISLYGSLIWNTAYAVFQLWLGVYHHTFWFYSLAGYYFSLALMRFFLVRHTRAYRPGARMRAELHRYRACGWVLLVMNLALSLMIFFMMYWNRTFLHHEITTIAMAAYTFTSFATAIVSVGKYRKYNSPVYSASKAINLAAACVSVLTLESTMLTTFGDGTMDAMMRKWMLGLSGAAVSAFVVVMAISMIVRSTRQLRFLKLGENEINGKQ